MNTILQRYVTKELEGDLKNGKSVLLLGPRQVGKSTLVKEKLGKRNEMERILLQDPSVRIRFEKDPGQLIRDIEPMKQGAIIFIDEVQKVPELMDSIQYLIDEKQFRFILTGSSARKLRRQNTNLLPGRVMLNMLDPLLWGELGLLGDGLIPGIELTNINEQCGYGLVDLMIYGSLPEMVGSTVEARAKELHSYTTIYLEEEIRAEAIVRKLGVFASFLQLVAQESGGAINMTKLSGATGVSLPTIREYFQILKDTLVIEELPIFTKKIRRQIVGSSKYYLFDVGVRNALIDAPLAAGLVNVQKGVLFEHVVVLELIRRSRMWRKTPMKLYYWRTRTGLEVDIVIEIGGTIIPIEIKASQDVSLSDLRGLTAFMGEYNLDRGYVITMDPRPQKISDKITALPWNYI